MDSAREIRRQARADVRNGDNPANVARRTVDQRNQLKVDTRDKMPSMLNRLAEMRNQRRYGNPIGKTYEMYSKGGKSDLDIIEGVGRTNSRIDRIFGVS